ncbi:MAG: hypothetical protein DRI99_07930, partial [Candidatus Aminicenantes bacterium]
MVLPKKLVLGGLLLIVLGGVFFLVILPLISPSEAENKGEETTPAENKTPSNIPVPVKVVKAQRGTLVISLKTPGEAYTEKNIKIKA